MFHFETDDSLFAARNKKGGENNFVLTSRGGGVLLDNTLGGSAGLPCQAGLRPHSRLLVQFVRRLTTKELVFVRFVALLNARVNDKKVNGSMRKNATWLRLLQVRKWTRSASRPREFRIAQEKRRQPC